MHVDDVLRGIDGKDEGICLFLGSEGQGLRKEVEQLCRWSVSIPVMDQMESLNVAVAGGILMYLMRPSLQKP